jgi:hypothetical protein
MTHINQLHQGSELPRCVTRQLAFASKYGVVDQRDRYRD